MTKKNTVTQLQIEALLAETDFEIRTIYGKVTVVVAKLPNGFTIVESSACVDPANYDEAIGVEICKQRIENQLWQLEGYLLQEQLYKEGKL
jgi:hypothetical protein